MPRGWLNQPVPFANTMKTSVTLPSIYPQALGRTLENIRDTTVNEVEILVVTPNIEPNMPMMRPGQEVVWIREEQRRGCAHAHTTAARRATGEFITATADDCAYIPGWDVAAITNYRQRAAGAGRMLCLGLHYGLVGTVFGIYYANFPFLRRVDALDLDYFDGNYKKGFTDSDFGLKVWSAGGRCEFTERRLIRITAEDKRKGDEDCPADDLGYFLEKWAARYGRGFDTSHMRAINIDFDPELYPELVDGFSVHDNTPAFVARATALAPPHRVESTGTWNIVWFRGAAHALPKSLGPISLENDDDRARVLKAGGASFGTIAAARSYALQVEAERAPPHLVESTGTWNIIWFRGEAHALPQSVGPINLENDDDRARVLRAGGASFGTIAEARSYALQVQAAGTNT